MRAVHQVAQSPQLRIHYEAAFGTLPDLSDPSRFPPNGRPIPGEPDHPHHLTWLSLEEKDRATIDLIFSNLGKALAAYQRGIISRDSRFDRFARTLAASPPSELLSPAAPSELLSPAAQRGLKLFVGEGRCRLCHSGPNFSDGEFHDLGLNLSRTGRRDPGRYAGIELVLTDPFNRLGRYSDENPPRQSALIRYIYRETDQLGQFKTPTLRSVTQSPPYMHDGRFATLEEVVRFYSQREGAVAVGHGDAFLEPLHLSETQIADLVAFLHTLDGAPVDPQLGFPSDESDG